MRAHFQIKIKLKDPPPPLFVCGLISHTVVQPPLSS